MSEVEKFDPNSLEEQLHLLSDRCRGCPFAKFIVRISFIKPFKDVQPLERIHDIEEECTGYQGELPEDSEIFERYTPDACPYLGVLAQRYNWHD